MKSEADVKKHVKRALASLGVGLWHYMPVPSGFGTQGVPDFICTFEGRFLGIETKFGKNALSKWQEMQRDRILAAGGLYLVVNERNVDKLEGALFLMRRTTFAIREWQARLNNKFILAVEFGDDLSPMLVIYERLSNIRSSFWSQFDHNNKGKRLLTLPLPQTAQDEIDVEKQLITLRAVVELEQ